MAKALKFSLKLQELPVEIIDAEGVPKTFTLRELTGQQRDTFLQDMKKRVVPGSRKDEVEVKNFDGLCASLLTKTLLDEEGNFVEKDAIQAYPATVVQSLFEASQELSKLGDGKKKTKKKTDDDDDDDVVKNE